MAGVLSVEVVAIQKYSMENIEGAQKKCVMEIIKSHCRFLVFVYLSGELYQVSMKLEPERSGFISLLESFKIYRKIDRLKLE